MEVDCKPVETNAQEVYPLSGQNGRSRNHGSFSWISA